MMIVEPAETLMVVISKSGSTAETATNTNVFIQQLEEKKLVPGEHLVAITVKDSFLWIKSKSENWLNQFAMNNETGGRTSICSVVSMIPCAFTNIDFGQFVKGMSAMDAVTR